MVTGFINRVSPQKGASLHRKVLQSDCWGGSLVCGRLSRAEAWTGYLIALSFIWNMADEDLLVKRAVRIAGTGDRRLGNR